MEAEKLYFVKKYQHVVELVFFPLLLTGLYLRFNIMEGNTFLIATSTIVLTLSYFLHARYNRTLIDLTTFDRLFLVIIFYSLAASLLGWLFKLQLWDNSKVMLMTGMAGVAISLIYLIKMIIQYRAKEFITTFIRGIIILAISNFIYTTSEKDMIHFIYQNDQEFIQLYDQMIESPGNTVYKEHFLLFKNDGKH